MDFHDAELKYAELKKQFDTGQIGAADFTSGVHELRLQDSKGVWWQIREQDGGWLRWNGSLWEWGNPNVSDKPYTPVISDTTKQGIGGGLETFHAMDDDQKRKYLVAAIIGVAILYAIFVFVQSGSGIGSNQKSGGDFLSGMGGISNIGFGSGSQAGGTNLAGTYQGFYQYDGTTAKYPFTITLRQSGSTLSGSIRESISTSGLNTQYLDSTLQGTVSGNSVYFVKTYNSGMQKVTYNGIYSSGTKQISGRWNVGSSGGSFVINT
jgi:hypothetical protein